MHVGQGTTSDRVRRQRTLSGTQDKQSSAEQSGMYSRYRAHSEKVPNWVQPVGVAETEILTDNAGQKQTFNNPPETFCDLSDHDIETVYQIIM
jgi:hypothetical protein